MVSWLYQSKNESNKPRGGGGGGGQPLSVFYFASHDYSSRTSIFKINFNEEKKRCCRCQMTAKKMTCEHYVGKSQKQGRFVGFLYF